MSNWLSRLFVGNRPGPSAATPAYGAQMSRRGQIAGDVEDRFLADDAAFDPGDAFKEYSAGAMSDFRAQLADELRKNAYGAADSGRLDTGFYDEDRGKISTDLARQYTADINRQALNTAGMRQRQIEFRGNYGLESGRDFQDLVAGQLDRETAERNARRQSRSGIISGLTQLAGTAIGFAAGGPPGAAAGAALTRRR